MAREHDAVEIEGLALEPVAEGHTGNTESSTGKSSSSAQTP